MSYYGYEEGSYSLAHYGVVGMKWKNRRNRRLAYARSKSPGSDPFGAHKPYPHGRNVNKGRGEGKISAGEWQSLANYNRHRAAANVANKRHPIRPKIEIDHRNEIEKDRKRKRAEDERRQSNKKYR